MNDNPNNSLEKPRAPQVPETWKTRISRWAFNLFPAYRGTGQRGFASLGFREVHIRLPLNWQTRNYVGTIFGGSMYGAVDPVFMLILIKALGPEYVVWDKAATIRFRRPGREQLNAIFRITSQDLEEIRDAVQDKGKIEPEYTVDLVNKSGEVHATCHKVLSIRRKNQGK